MRIRSCFSVLFLAAACDFAFSVNANTLNRNSENYVDFPFYGSLPLNYAPLSSYGQKRRSMSLDAARSVIGHSLRVRKSQQSMRDKSFSHALRVRRGRQWDAMGHTLRIKRTAPSRDALRSFGHALRVRRGDDQDDEKFNEGNYDSENFNENQEFSPEVTNWSDSESFAGRPRRFMADRRASDGVRLHTLRVKKANEDLWNKFFLQAQEQQAGARPALMSNASWAKRKATLNHVLRVRKDNQIFPAAAENIEPATGSIDPAGREEENTNVVYYY